MISAFAIPPVPHTSRQDASCRCYGPRLYRQFRNYLQHFVSPVLDLRGPYGRTLPVIVE
jgi:hypothetical protein